MRLLLVLTASLILAGSALAGEYHVVPSGKNEVKFISDAPIEDFEGVTSQIDGYMYWDDDDMLKNCELYFEVDLNSVDTGISLRNRHMRENYLETDKFPTTHFKGKILRVQNDSTNQSKVLVQGKMFIHGVERDKTVEGLLIKTGDGYRVKCNFTIKLSDYKINIPSIMFYKINEEMQLSVNFRVKLQTEES